MSDQRFTPPPDGFQQGRDWYSDPVTGLLVMTEHYLRQRGWCCRKDCRHCPWDNRGPRAPSRGTPPTP